MINSIISEVNDALHNNLYLAALTLVLTIPDICGKAQYPELKAGPRYIKWFDEHIGKYERPPNSDNSKCVHLTGEIIYSLRNSILHQGNPNIDNTKIKEEQNRIDRFVLVKEPENQFGIYGDASAYYDCFINITRNVSTEYRMSIRRLCLIICSTAEQYYEDNKEQFDFFSYNIVDKGHENDWLFE